jgi:4-oxalocrotonate tautomerase
MPIVTVELIPGRTEDQKQQLAEAMTEAMVKIAGSTRENVWVKFIEIPRENWSIGGTLITRRSKAK